MCVIVGKIVDDDRIGKSVDDVIEIFVCVVELEFDVEIVFVDLCIVVV